jgi:hypothetical protein
MTSILFFGMVAALLVGACCFGLSCLFKVRESRRRIVFFAACLLGFWGACVSLLADGVADLFVAVQVGMEESVHNAFLQHWQKLGREITVADEQAFPRSVSRLCTAQDLASPRARDCSLALGVNSTSVCRQWVLYVPFFLPYLRPCPALRTNTEILDDAVAREALVDAINQPCRYLPTSLDYVTKRIRKALGCGGTPAFDNVLLIVDHLGGAKTMVLHRGSAQLP